MFCVLCLVTQSHLTLCNPVDSSPPGSSVHRILQARTWKWVAIPPPGYLPNPGIKPRSPKLQADSLLTKPPRKPQNTGMGSLFLLQGIFPTQELNQGLRHCRWVLHQLSYRGSAQACIFLFKCQQGTSQCGSYISPFILFCVSR